MAMGLGPKKGLKSEINVTPLVDVVLVLLIIFMVVTPLLQRGKDVTLPKATQVIEKDDKVDPLVVSVTVDRELYIENRRFEDETFIAVMAQALKAAPGRRVLLKGDHRLAFDDVRRVMRLTREAGARSVALAVEAVPP